MNGSFELSARWLSPSLPDARDVAELQLHAAGETLTRLSDFERKEERNYTRGSAVSLALWFADNFWRLRYESLPNGFAPSTNWRLRHEMTSAAGGTLWPPIMIHSTGERILIAPVFAKPVDIGTVRYILPNIATVPGSDFTDGVMRFFEVVVTNCTQSADGLILRELVENIKSEASDPELLSWRRIEARLGYDPDTAPDDLILSFGTLEDQVGKAAVDEAAAAAPGRRSNQYLLEAIEAAKESEIIVNFEIAEAVAAEVRSTAALMPWQLGREAAKQIRTFTGADDQPLRNKAFTEILKLSSGVIERRGTARGLPYSARLRESGEYHRIALQSADLRDRRFELSCALADEIWINSDFGVISKAKTDRQKFQRAFAQNFLVPIDGLARKIDLTDPTEQDINHAAKSYHVHPNVIKRLLVLEGFIQKETFEEILDAA